MIEFTFADLLAATGASVARRGVHDDVRLAGVTTDSRDVLPGQLFVGIHGPNFDGNAYAATAIERGAGAVLLSDLVAASKLPASAPVALTNDTLRALGDLASWHRSRLDCPVLGITGSCGKTTTKDVAAALLAPVGEVVAAAKSYNNAIGVPLTLLRADARTRAVVLEIGTNAPGEIATLTRIARPYVGLVTMIGHSHLEGLDDLEGVASEKGALGEHLGPDDHLVLPAASPYLEHLSSRTRAQVRTFGEGGEGDWSAEDVRTDADGSSFTVRGRRVTTRLVGRHNVLNVTAAIAAVDAMGFDALESAAVLAEFEGAPHRMQRTEVHGITLLDDTYNSNPDSARAAMRVLSDANTSGRRVMVFGDMLELGARSQLLHTQIGVEAAAARVELLVCVGDLARATAAGAMEGGMPSDRVVHVASVDEAVTCVPRLVETGDVVLFKASRGMRLERVVESVGRAHGREAEGAR
ncbi:MAG: UDP-N-acetylmuramoyl-tripeptide--D-alanyl-D-alanine ligase [Planctomycetota bacterium]